MKQFVADASVIMSWCFEDETDTYSERTLEALDQAEILVPPVCPLEIANVLLIAEKKKRITQPDSARFLNLLSALPIKLDQRTPFETQNLVLAIARQHSLSSYDASYLELSVHHGIPLATRDKALRQASKKAGIGLWV